MKTSHLYLAWFALALVIAPREATAGFTLPEMSPQSKACVECHRKESPAIYQQWGASKHFRGNIGCYECHMALKGEPDAFSAGRDGYTLLYRAVEREMLVNLAEHASVALMDARTVESGHAVVDGSARSAALWRRRLRTVTHP